MPETNRKPISSSCRQCKGATQHDILAIETINHSEYHATTSYMIVRCRGCLSIGFREDFDDYEQGYPDPDDDSNWLFPTETQVYPRFISGHHDLRDGWHVPYVVRKIYEQSLLAIREDAGILAGLGLRATIEAVCNDRNIGGSNLERRISALSNQGLISKKDAERLHAIRFLGNDAAHEIREPSKSQLSVALDIIEHLLTTMYILPYEVNSKLDTIVSSFEDFSPLLAKSIQEFSPGDEFPLAKFAGKYLRRVKDALHSLEAELINAIKAGSFKALELGSVVQAAPPGKPPQPMQLFRVK